MFSYFLKSLGGGMEIIPFRAFLGYPAISVYMSIYLHFTLKKTQTKLHNRQIPI